MPQHPQNFNRRQINLNLIEFQFSTGNFLEYSQSDTKIYLSYAAMCKVEASKSNYIISHSKTTSTKQILMRFSLIVLSFPSSLSHSPSIHFNEQPLLPTSFSFFLSFFLAKFVSIALQFGWFFLGGEKF